MNLKLLTVSLLVVAVASSVALTGCKKKEAAPEQTEQTTIEQTTAPADQAAAPAEQAATESHGDAH
jgi:PBP1b-binding outer membrane lipoprotein LpoB